MLAQWIKFASCGVSKHHSQIYCTSWNIKGNSTTSSNVGHTIMIARKLGMHKFIFHSAHHHIKSVIGWRMCFKPEKCDLFVAFDFSISYTPNCTISSNNFETNSGERLTEPPPQTPPPLLLGLRPRFGLRPQFSRASRPRLGLRPRIRPREANLDSSLAEPPLAFLSGCAPADSKHDESILTHIVPPSYI